MHSTRSSSNPCRRRAAACGGPAAGWTTTSTPASRPSSAGARALGLAGEQRGRRRALARPSAKPGRPAERVPRGRNIAARQPLRCYQGRDEHACPSEPPLALIAGPTASGKSALALALAEAADGMIDQRRQRPGLSRPARSSRRGRRRRRRRGRRTASTALATAPIPARRRTGRRTRAPRSPRRTRRAGCRSWSAAPASISAP